MIVFKKWKLTYKHVLQMSNWLQKIYLLLAKINGFIYGQEQGLKRNEILNPQISDKLKL